MRKYVCCVGALNDRGELARLARPAQRGRWASPVGTLPDDFSSTAWASLAHAYGSAEDIPALLRNAETDTRGGHIPGSPWFSLWSALCHQGDSYAASYAAVPHLIRLARLPPYSSKYDPIYLAACIEVSRLEGRGPSLDVGCSASYLEALRQGKELATKALAQPLDQNAKRVFEGCVSAFAGDHAAARTKWDKEEFGAA